MNDDLKQKLAKIYELVKRGTDGEKAAAKKALDRMIAKYNLDGIDLDAIDKKRYRFKYATKLDIVLIIRITKTFIEGGVDYKTTLRDTRGCKEICMDLTYLDFVTIETAYGYFKPHMNKQWKKFCAPNLKRCRTAKSRNKRREELANIFFLKYAIASDLYKPHELTTVSMKDMSQREISDRQRLADVEGGKYSKQVTTGLLLEA